MDLEMMRGKEVVGVRECDGFGAVIKEKLNIDNNSRGNVDNGNRLPDLGSVIKISSLRHAAATAWAAKTVRPSATSWPTSCSSARPSSSPALPTRPTAPSSWPTRPMRPTGPTSSMITLLITS
uniref:Uncharacterized protein n=1 Tax=Ananas comosus var. bracteatus TaxID=296719 RepID=A0A6V7Q5F7_ANACO|nr:unnamed protein product [Ananas comosus var. bracteatus]